MNRNLITRMGTASGVVAALVAAVFAVLVTAVRDQRSSTDRARQSEQVSAAATDVSRALTVVDLGTRGHLGGEADIRQVRAQLPKLVVILQRDVADEPAQRTRVTTLADGTTRYLRDARSVPVARLERQVQQIIATERTTADERRNDADRKARQAIALGIGGLVGSALLIALLTTYLTRYIVVPLRRTVKPRAG